MIYIWLDESDRHGEFYSNFYGGILIPSRHHREVLARMRSIVEATGIKDEVKWQKLVFCYYGRGSNIFGFFGQRIDYRVNYGFVKDFSVDKYYSVRRRDRGILFT